MKTTADTCTPTNYLRCAGRALAGVSARDLNRMEAWELETCSFEDRQQYGACRPVIVRRGSATIVNGVRVFTITTTEEG